MLDARRVVLLSLVVSGWLSGCAIFYDMPGTDGVAISDDEPDGPSNCAAIDCQPTPACVPAACAASDCGEIDDGCGGTIACDCPDGAACESDSQCQSGICELDACGDGFWSVAGDSPFAEQQLFDAVVDSTGATITTGMGSVDGVLWDVVVAKYAPSGKLQWQQTYGAKETSVALTFGIAVDSHDNIVVAGAFTTSLTIGAYQLHANPSGGPANDDDTAGADGFVFQLAPSGAALWARRFGDGCVQKAYDVAVDSEDDVLIAGTYEGALGLDGSDRPFADDFDGFIARLDGASGESYWATAVGGTGRQSLTGVAVGADGRIVAAGLTGGVTFTPTGLYVPNNDDGFIVGLSPAGEVDTFEAYGGYAEQGVARVALDAYGNVAVTGFFHFLVEADGQTAFCTVSGQWCAFVAMHSSVLDLMWIRGFSGDGVSIGTDVAFHDGNVVMAATFAGWGTFGVPCDSDAEPTVFSGHSAVALETDVLFAAFDTNGTCLRGAAFGIDGNSDVRAVAPAPDGAVHIAGGFTGSIAFTDPALSKAQDRTTYIAKLPPTGRAMRNNRGE